ncbi:hypothetical protein MJO55_06810 [Mycolicibacterium rufum]|uniref:Uncharacterized protein n=1 Tax=Mycolicibacterium rufum TaxID=318424 RepID=A0A9X2YEX9_9MYCO|nr:hypothetical protein [Mycolicibacterium rufum]KGI67240.1 hypothetical protein EU78_06970 [Mycolicibacterium rufum]MCV7072682.1 hypothetical protein [Mycolicibacterium rufum]ULP38132.1 hypothetical protein MJO55_06810 [Mycolicibacterium rufum]
MRLAYIIVASALVCAALEAPPTAHADCVSSGGTTVCSQGEVRGADNGAGAGGSGPYVPYPCSYDWYCNDGVTWDINMDWDPGVGIGAPGRPGNRPGGGGGGGGRGGRR